MKKFLVMMLCTVFLAKAVGAADWNYQSDEWPIPAGIKSEADLEKYEGYRKGFMIAGVFAILGAVIMDKNAKGLKHKADTIDDRGPVISVPVAGGGSMGVQTMQIGLTEARQRFYGKADMYKKGTALFGLAALSLLSISFSLRF